MGAPQGQPSLQILLKALITRTPTQNVKQCCFFLKDGKSGRTPLHHAVEAENLEVINELLECGANVSEGAFSGNTPLQVASGRCMQNVRLLLESAGSNIKSASGKYKEVRK